MASSSPNPGSSTSTLHPEDPEDQIRAPTKVPHHRLVFDQACVTDEVLNHPYRGDGSEKNPYVVEWIPNDPRNPMNWSQVKKWSITMAQAIATLAVAFVSTAYTGAIEEIIVEFGCSTEVATLGVSLFVLGFALGPLVWAPMSELYGRQILFIGTYVVLTAMNAGAAGAQSIATLIVLRFLAGTFGASPLTNAGGVIADMFPADQRGLGMSIFAAAPFLGPAIGPIVGGFAGVAIGWRWVEGIMAIFTGVLLIFCGLVVPETYAPVLLAKRAKELSKRTGKSYVSIIEKRQGKQTLKEITKKALVRPWVLLFLGMCPNLAIGEYTDVAQNQSCSCCRFLWLLSMEPCTCCLGG
jgi:multidrug resistance protein